MWLEHTQRRDKVRQGESTDGWIGENGRETKAHQQRRSNLVFNTQPAQRALENSTAETR